MKTPNPQLKNTAIYVGNDAELRKRAIEYYENNGFKKQQEKGDYQYIGTFIDSEKYFSDFINVGKTHTIITLPEPEPKAEYPCMMMVSNDSMDIDNKEVKLTVIGELNGKFITKKNNSNRDLYAWDNAKPIPTTTITTEELIEFYEKNTNTKVILSN
jgi:hypothetical protein